MCNKTVIYFMLKSVTLNAVIDCFKRKQTEILVLAKNITSETHVEWYVNITCIYYYVIEKYVKQLFVLKLIKYVFITLKVKTFFFIIIIHKNRYN